MRSVRNHDASKASFPETSHQSQPEYRRIAAARPRAGGRGTSETSQGALLKESESFLFSPGSTILRCANGFPPLLICNCLVECAAWRKRSQEKLKEIVGRLFHRLEMADVHVDIDTDAEAEVVLKGRQTFGVL